MSPPIVSGCLSCGAFQLTVVASEAKKPSLQQVSLALRPTRQEGRKQADNALETTSLSNALSYRSRGGILTLGDLD